MFVLNAMGYSALARSMAHAGHIDAANRGSKRDVLMGDMSYSYSATDFGVHNGSHIKTITVIKNFASPKTKNGESIHLSDRDRHRLESNKNFKVIVKLPEIPTKFDEYFVHTERITKKSVTNAPTTTTKSPTPRIKINHSRKKANAINRLNSMQDEIMHHLNRDISDESDDPNPKQTENLEYSSDSDPKDPDYSSDENNSNNSYNPENENSDSVVEPENDQNSDPNDTGAYVEDNGDNSDSGNYAESDNSNNYGDTEDANDVIEKNLHPDVEIFSNVGYEVPRDPNRNAVMVEDFSDYSMHNVKHLVDPKDLQWKHNGRPYGTEKLNSKKVLTTKAATKIPPFPMLRSQSIADHSQHSADEFFEPLKIATSSTMRPPPQNAPKVETTVRMHTPRPLVKFDPQTSKNLNYFNKKLPTKIVSTTQEPYVAPFKRRFSSQIRQVPMRPRIIPAHEYQDEEIPFALNNYKYMGVYNSN